MGFRDAIKTGGGGFLNNVDVEFTGYNFVDHSFNEEKTGDYCYFVPEFKVDGADEPVTQSFFIGGNDRYEISKDGQELTMEDGSPVTFTGKMGMGRFIAGMLDKAEAASIDLESELPDLASGEALSFETLVGRRFRVKQEIDVERNNKSGKRRVKDKKTGKMVEYPHTYTVIDAVLGASSNGNGAKATPAAAGKKGKKGGKAISIDAEAEATLKEIVEAGDASVKNLSLLSAKKLMKMKQTDQPKAEAIRAKILDSDFRDGLDWLETDKKGLLSVAE